MEETYLCCWSGDGGDLTRLRSRDRWRTSSSEDKHAALGIAAPFPLNPRSAGRQDRAFPTGSREVLASFFLLTVPSSHLLISAPKLGRAPAPSPAGGRWGGREGKAAAWRLRSRAEASCSSGAPAFAGMAARYETARVRSNAARLPSLTKTTVVLARGKQQLFP